jgi:Carbohydrate family 9 binding domain-like
MKSTKIETNIFLIVILVFLLTNTLFAEDSFPIPKLPFTVTSFVCHPAEGPIVVDGILDESSWLLAEETDLFIDIEGDLKPKPYFTTRAKMLWDSEYFYVSAELEEPHVWGTLTDRDAVIYHDNDFEVFIDPNSDSYEYYELEINTLGTEWDLLLLKPYRDGAPAINAWDIQGLKTAVHINGTLNDPSDDDSGWSVEIAFPWSVLKECAHKATPPEEGDQWRVNFSRVQWQHDVQDNSYVKKINPDTGKSYPEYNWTWAPQGLIAMHYPERWGYVQFTSEPLDQKVKFIQNDREFAIQTLWQIYYAERDYQNKNGNFTNEISELNLFESVETAEYFSEPEIFITPFGFIASITDLNSSEKLTINSDGLLRTR